MSFWGFSYSGQYLLEAYIIIPIHMVQLPKTMALRHVDFVGERSHACRYLITCSVLGSSYTFLMYCPESVQLIRMVS